MLFVSALAFIVNRLRISEPNPGNENAVSYKPGAALFVFIIALSLTVFSGLRQSYNDTSAYILSFTAIPNNFSGGLDYTNIVLFQVLQISIKKFISNNPQWFLMITSLFVNFTFVFFFYKKSPNFLLSMIFYIIMGPFVFSMAGLKQTLAMTFGIIALGRLINGRKILFIFWVAVAWMFHPFAPFYVILLFFTKDIWSWRVMLLIAAAIFVGIFYNALVPAILSAASMTGKEGYTSATLLSEGVNIYRLAFEAILPILAFVFRKRIRAQNSRILNIAVNMSCISFAFLIIAYISSPVYFGRMSTYFIILRAVLFPWILIYCFKDKIKPLIVSGTVALYFIFFYLDFTHFGQWALDFKFNTLTNLFNSLGAGVWR